MALPPITKRIDKGLALTYQELDDNFTNLDLRAIDLDERIRTVSEGGVDLTGFTTNDIAEGDRLYYTVGRANSAIDARVTKSFVAGLNVSTDDLVEGDNLFYTDQRVNNRIDGRVTKSFVDGLNINADKLDGINSSSFLRSDTDDTFTGTLTVDGDIRLGTNRVFHEGFHPNADVLTTSRTIALSGDASGSVSFDGSNNVTINVSVSNSVNSDKLDGLHAGSFVFGNNSDNGPVTIVTDDAPFILKDNTNGVTNYIWRKPDEKILNLGTNDAAVVFRGPTPKMDTNDVLWHEGNMGPGSGLNADKLDGLHASDFAREGNAFVNYGSNDSDIIGLVEGSNFGKIFEGPTNGHVVIGIRGNDDKDGFYVIDTDNNPDGDYAQSLLELNSVSFKYKGNDIWHTGNDGSGSNLNADKLDGLHASQFMRSDQNVLLDGKLSVDFNNTDALTLRKDDDAKYSGISFVTGNNTNWLLYTHNDGTGNMSLQTRNYKSDGGYRDTVWRVDWESGVQNFPNNPTVDGNEVIHDGNKVSKVDSIYALDVRDSFVPGSNGSSDYMPDPEIDFFDRKIRLLFTKDTPHSSWASVVNVKGWNQGYSAWQMSGGSSTSTDQEWYLRSGVNTSWDSWHRIWHDGNDGPGSGLNADYLDGYHHTGFLKADAENDYIDFKNYESADFSREGRLFYDASVGMYISASNAKHPNPAALWSSANFTAGSDLSVSYDNEDMPTLSVQSSTSDSDNTLAKRNGSGDIYARLFRSTYGTSGINDSADIIMRNNNSGDNYLRPVTAGTFFNWFDANVNGLHVNGNLVNVGNIYFNNDSSGDWIDWNTTEGLRFFENGSQKAQVGPNTWFESSVNLRGHSLRGVSQVDFDGGSGAGDDRIQWSTGNGLQFYENGNWVARVGSNTRLPSNTRVDGGHVTHSNLNANENGSIMFLKKVSNGFMDLADTTYGNNLRVTGTDLTNGGFNLTGTWEALGRCGHNQATLFRRIA